MVNRRSNPSRNSAAIPEGAARVGCGLPDSAAGAPAHRNAPGRASVRTWPSVPATRCRGSSSFGYPSAAKNADRSKRARASCRLRGRRRRSAPATCRIYRSSRKRRNGSLSPMLAIFDDGANRLAPKATGLCGALIAVNLLVWAWAFAAFRSYPMLLATALIAYGFGLRHAVDADHIAAIDNATRKLMQEGKRPITVGLFFSLGHSTVVFAASLVIALTASSLQQRFPGLIEAGGVVGTLVSVFFLIGIAIINFFVLVGVYRLFKRVRRGKTYTEEELNVFLSPRGLFGRLLRGLFRLISR